MSIRPSEIVIPPVDPLPPISVGPDIVAESALIVPVTVAP